jgi:hypothetical protein
LKSLKELNQMENKPLDSSYTFKQTAIPSKKRYQYFGITPQLASMYGRKESEIVALTMQISEDQSLPCKNDRKILIPDYWGWYDFEKKEFGLIHPKRFLLSMCFAYGISAAQEANQGKAYRVVVVK